MGGSYQTTDYQHRVASGTIPAIQIGDWILHDSQAILEYLEEQYSEPAMWSKDVRCRAEQRALTHYHDTKLEPAVRCLVPLVKMADSRERDLQIDSALDQLFDRVFRLNKMVNPSPWLTGQAMSPADFCFPVTLQMGLDLLTHFGRKLALPSPLENWLDHASKFSLIEEEISRVRGAIALWLGHDGELN